MKVLLFANVGTDYHGYYHVGDEAMFLEISHFYASNFPKATVSALVSLPIHRNQKLIQRRGSGWPDKKLPALKYFLTFNFKTLIWRKFGISFFTEEQQSYIQFIQTQDFIHFTGGGNLSSECEHWFYYALFVISTAKMLVKPVILTSQTIGPFSSWIDVFIATRVLNTVDSITLREHSDIQEKNLKRLGIRHPRFLRSLDAAYFLPVSPEISETSFRLKKKVLRIGLSLHERENNAKVLEKILNSALLPITKKNTPVEILLLPHMLNQHDEWDTAFMQKLIKGLPATFSIIIPTYTSLVNNKLEFATQIKALTNTCNLVISSRYHGVVFSLSQNVPCISIVDGEYQHIKNLEALRFLFDEDAESFIIDAHDPEAKRKVQTLIRTTLKTLPQIRKKLRSRNAILQKEYQMYLNNLVQEIRKIHTSQV